MLGSGSSSGGWACLLGLWRVMCGESLEFSTLGAALMVCVHRGGERCVGDFGK